MELNFEFWNYVCRSGPRYFVEWFLQLGTVSIKGSDEKLDFINELFSKMVHLIRDL